MSASRWDMVEFEHHLRRYARVPVAGGAHKPFVCNPGQQRAIETVGGFAGEPGFWPIVKGRQGGITTFCLSHIAWLCMTRALFSVLVVASSEEPIGIEVLAKWRRLLDLLEPGSPYRGLQADNRHESIFKGTLSRVTWAHIGGTQSVADQVGRAGTFDLVLLTEYGFPHEADFARRALESLMPALERSDAPVIGDSTPGELPGTGEAYAEMIMGVQSGRLPGGIHHVGWWEVEETLHRRPLPMDPEDYRETLTAEEEALMRRHYPAIDLERIAWRRAKMHREKMPPAKARRLFLRAYPETVADALRPSEGEGSLFDASVIEQLRAMAKAGTFAEPIMWSKMRGLFPEPIRNDLLCKARWGSAPDDLGDGYCRVWHAPLRALETLSRMRGPIARGIQYFAGVDTSDGRPGGDWQTCGIIDRNGAPCAYLRTRIEPARFAAHTQRLCAWYGASIVVEAPHGTLTWRLLKGAIALETWGAELPAGTLPGELEALAVPYPGSVVLEPTTKGNRPQIISGAMGMLEAPGGCKDPEMLAEMESLHRDTRSGGKIKARTGAHDDIVMSLGIAEHHRLRTLEGAQRAAPRSKLRRGARRNRYGYVGT